MNMNVEATYKLPDGFRTSINVLNRVLNMPSSTIEHELKKHNYSFYSQSSNCIDEKMLDIFAEKFCKNLKRYFERSLQEFETLSYEESNHFQEFVQTYSKHGRFTRKWRDIDKVAIKDDFLRQVVEFTTCRKRIVFEISDSLKEACATLLKSVICTRTQHCDSLYRCDLSTIIDSVICGCNYGSPRVFDATDLSLSNPYILCKYYDLDYHLYTTPEIKSHHYSASELISEKQRKFHNRVYLFRQIKQSRLYRSRRPTQKFTIPKFASIIVRIYACARLYTVPDDGTEEEINFYHSLRVNKNSILTHYKYTLNENDKKKEFA